ncbi:hypothetical protein P3C29_29580 [Pseudomonas sp. 1912-s]|uniref:hypothetical protein n=1 Tax=Pseudomonas sp. 1912-s TaxID=3033802 RepID=UPI0023E03186|nr:hypothetical protein [Pseudomonas sp. 1912-s]MDF3202847.1 hypothetical protein [Pseudomonas sp. 1912-s]
MNTELTEEDMRRALFGESETSEPAAGAPTRTATDIVIMEPIKTAKKKHTFQGFAPKIRVTLRVGNDFEGKTYEMVHEVYTLSFLLAEQEATKTARKKFRFVEVISIMTI